VNEIAGEACSRVETSSWKGTVMRGENKPMSVDCCDPGHPSTYKPWPREGSPRLCAATGIKHSQHRTVSKIPLITVLSLLWVTKRSVGVMGATRCDMSPSGWNSSLEFPPAQRLGGREAENAIGVCRSGSYQTSKSRRESETICRVL